VGHFLYAAAEAIRDAGSRKEGTGMKTLHKRLKSLEISSIDKLVVIEHRSDETEAQAISRQFPDGLPDAEIHVFIRKFICDENGELLLCD
jgi:hypothetical protein